MNKVSRIFCSLNATNFTQELNYLKKNNNLIKTFQLLLTSQRREKMWVNQHEHETLSAWVEKKSKQF